MPTLELAVLRPAPVARTLDRLPGAGVTPELRVVAGIGADGPKLVEASLEALLSLRRSAPELVIVPESWGRTARVEPPEVARAAVEAAASDTGLRLTLRDAATGRPLAGADVRAFTDYAGRVGADATSDGVVRLRLAAARVERLLVYGPAGYWGLHRQDVDLADGDDLPIRPIDLAEPGLLLGRLARELPADAGRGVRIGVLDTGIAAGHPDLPVAFGRNCVSAELMRDATATDAWGPAGVGGEHGTHVAGIVGARGRLLRGVAPAAELVSYRVFAADSAETSSFDIADAIDKAADGECDILNLSLSFAAPDDTVRRAIGEAIDRGVLVVAAAATIPGARCAFPPPTSRSWPSPRPATRAASRPTPRTPPMWRARAAILTPLGSPRRSRTWGRRWT